MKYQRILTIYNPEAGRKRWFEERTIRRALDSYQCYKEWLRLTRETNLHNVDWRSFDLILVAGGDGTVRSVVQTLYDNGVDVPVAIIPTGSANILAFSLGVPWRLKSAVHFAMNNSVKKIDIALANNDKVFLIGLSAGFDAKAIGLTPRRWKKTYGLLAYLANAMRVVFSNERYRFKISIDGTQKQESAGSVIVLNNGSFFGLPFGPNISIIDGQLNIVVLHTVAFFKLMGIFFRLLFRKYDNLKNVTYYYGSDIELHVPIDVSVEIDGEPYVAENVAIKVLPRKTSVIAKQLE